MPLQEALANPGVYALTQGYDLLLFLGAANDQVFSAAADNAVYSFGDATGRVSLGTPT